MPDNEDEAREGEDEPREGFIGIAPEYQNAAYDTDAPADEEPGRVAKRVLRQEIEGQTTLPTGIGANVGVDEDEDEENYGVPSDDGPVDEAPDRLGDASTADDDDDGSDGGSTKGELYARAGELDVPGRSSMSKDELEKAVAEAERG